MTKAAKATVFTVRDALGGSQFGERVLAALELSSGDAQTWLDVPTVHRFGRAFLGAFRKAKELGDLLMRRDPGANQRSPVGLLVSALEQHADYLWDLGVEGGVVAEFPPGLELVAVEGALSLNIESSDQLVVGGVTRNLVEIEDLRRQPLARCQVVELFHGGAVLRETGRKITFRVMFSGV